MKKTFTTFLAIASIVALAVPAHADKPQGKGKPGVQVLVTAAPGWAIHAADDVITYAVEILNTGRVAFESISVTGTFDLTYEEGDDDPLDGNLDPGETWLYTGSYIVTPPDLSLTEITNTVEVRQGNAAPMASASNSVNVSPYPACGFTYDSEGIGTMGISDPLDWQLCVWAPTATGSWRLTGDSAATGRKGVNAQLTVRDYVPGDWCGATADRLRSGEQLVLDLALPDDGSGGCPGGDYDDANPATYYIATQGLDVVTAAWLPPPPEN